MAILTHGSDLSLAPTITPVVRATDGSVRTALARLGAAGFSSVQLDAALSGTRPRELDSTARRDLIATARRAGLTIGGLDLFIPRDHYTDPAHVDRATLATLAAIELAGDLGRAPLSVNLPIDSLHDDVEAALVAGLEASGVTLVVHAEDQLEALANWLGKIDSDLIGAGLDPAVCLGGRSDPTQTVQAMIGQLAGARLSDNPRGLADGSRCLVGSGDLDLMSYRISLDLAPRRRGPVVLDLRGLSQPLDAAALARRAWDDAGVSL
ncbi:MAG: hypothetical protein AAGH88_10190 [Planctomycetota bacterium]